MNDKKRGSFGQLKGVSSVILVDALAILNPMIKANGLTQSSLIDKLARKANFMGNLDFLELDFKDEIQTQAIQSKLISNELPQLPQAPQVPYYDVAQYITEPQIIEPTETKQTLSHTDAHDIYVQIAELTKFTQTLFNEIKGAKSDITKVAAELKARPIKNTQPTVLMNENIIPTTSLSQLFREQFNGASIEDYHEILANGLSRNSNSVFTQSSNTSEKPTSVMYKFIESFNSQYRILVTNYIQNETLVAQLSITDNVLTNYVKGRYQQLGDMETYTKLTTLNQYDLTLEELTELLEPLKEHSFSITKLLNDDKYKPMSLQSRFKSSFNQEFESCWIDNTITEFMTI